jgi:hypothetical protein
MTREPARASKARIYHDATGRIVSIVAAEAGDQGPPAGIASPEGSRWCEIELSGELAGVPLLDLHSGYRVDLTAEVPRLERADKAGESPRPAKRRRSGH